MAQKLEEDEVRLSGSNEVSQDNTIENISNSFDWFNIDEEYVDRLNKRYEIINSLKDKLLVKDQDYWYSGTNPKPVLLKSGAEKLYHLFRLIPRPVELEQIRQHDFVSAYFRIDLVYVVDNKDIIVGSGYGYCCSEEKASWAKNPLAYANNIIKMAKKRAIVDAVLSTLGVSNLFTQDLEDMPDDDDLPKHASQDEKVIEVNKEAKPQDKQVAFINTLIKQVQKMWGKSDADMFKIITSILPAQTTIETMTSEQKSAFIDILKMMKDKRWNKLTTAIVSSKNLAVSNMIYIRSKWGNDWLEHPENLEAILAQVTKG